MKFDFSTDELTVKTILFVAISNAYELPCNTRFLLYEPMITVEIEFNAAWCLNNSIFFFFVLVLCAC